MTSGWSWFITIVSLANIVGMLWLFLANGRATVGKKAASDAGASDTGTSDTGHVWDGDLTELNNPQPRWWFWLFIISVFWGLGYLVFYPGLGRYAGTLGWTSQNQHTAEVLAANESQAPRYARFAALSLEQLAQDPDAMGEARSRFANGCAGCHGSDARGAVGFPNLTDNDWLYGNAPDTLLATIGGGRIGVMPGWQAALGDAGVAEVVAYVQSLSGTAKEPDLVQAGAARFATFCVACHGADAHGNQVLGAPNLADDIWLHGGDAASLRTTIAGGRQNQMPAHEALLGKDRVRLMAAYVLSLGSANAGTSAGTSAGRSNDGSAGGG